MDSVTVLAAEADLRAWLAGGLILAVVLGFVAFFLGALVSILRSPLAGGMKLVWVIFAFCAPFLGCALWFLVGRRSAEGGVHA